MKSLIYEHWKDRHYECIGMVIEHLISNGCNDIEIFLKDKEKARFAQDWIDFYKKNYENIINLTFLDSLQSTHYNTIFFLTAEEINEFSRDIVSLNIKLDKLVGIVHSAKYLASKNKFEHPLADVIRAKNPNLTERELRIRCNAIIPVETEGFNYPPNIELCAITPIIKLPQIKINFRLNILPSEYPDEYYPSTKYFITGNPQQYDFERLNNLLVSINETCLFVSRMLIKPYSNIISCKAVSTKDMIRCFFHKKIIFYTKENSVYQTDRLSGLIHLSYSFGTTVYMIKEIFDIYKNEDTSKIFIPYLSDEDLMNKLTNK